MAYAAQSLCAFGPTIWRLVEGFAMSPPLLFVFSASRGLLKAFADDVEQIRTAAYAYRQYDLWSDAVGTVAVAFARWDPDSGGPNPFVCYCNDCGPGDYTPDVYRCRRMKILLFRYSPYVLDSPGLEWTPRCELYWPYANRGPDWYYFTEEDCYADLTAGAGVAKDGEEYYMRQTYMWAIR